MLNNVNSMDLFSIDSADTSISINSSNKMFLGKKHYMNSEAYNRIYKKYEWTKEETKRQIDMVTKYFKDSTNKITNTKLNYSHDKINQLEHLKLSLVETINNIINNKYPIEYINLISVYFNEIQNNINNTNNIFHITQKLINMNNIGYRYLNNHEDYGMNILCRNNKTNTNRYNLINKIAKHIQSIVQTIDNEILKYQSYT